MVPKPAPPHSETSPDPSAVISELARIAASSSFRKAERCLRLLRHLTTAALEGRSDELKEYSLGVTVFERAESYLPATDPVVRLEVRRLRLKLAEYYQNEGTADAVIIDIPKGAYVPEFRFRHTPAAAAPEPAAGGGAHGRIRITVSAAAIVIALSATSWGLFRRPAPVTQLRPSVAVLGFENLSPQREDTWISTAISELMRMDLGAGRQLRMMPLESVARMRTELALPVESQYAVPMLQRIRANLGSDYVVTGSYQPQGQVLRVNVILSDARSGRQAAIREEGPLGKLPEIVSRCAQRVQSQLGVRLAVSGYRPLENDAMQRYAVGMEALRNGDALRARAELEQAEEAVSSDPLVHAGLAASWSALGQDARARQEAKLALDSSAGLGRLEQLEIEARYRAIAQDWAQAEKVYQALFTLLPDDLEYGLLLANAQTMGGKARDAVATVKMLRDLPSPMGDDPRINLAEARAAGALSDFAGTRQWAHSAAAQAKARGATLQYAKARLLEAGAMQTLAVAGYAEARSEARNICSELGDLACVAAAYRIEANEMVALGHLAAARTLYQLTLAIADRLGNALEKLNALNGMATAAKMQGDLSSAEMSYRAALAVSQEMGAQKTYPINLGLADVVAEEGRIGEARALAERALQVAREIGEQEGVGLGQAAIANLLALEGRSSEAIGKYSEAVGTLREVKEPYALGETLLDAGNTQLERGDLAAAQKSFEETRSLSRSFGSSETPEIDIAFARLSFAEGRMATAASYARLALDGFGAAGREGDRFEAAAVLARALIAQRRNDEASGVLALLPAADSLKVPPRNWLSFQIARCFVLAGTGRREEAMRIMDAVTARAARFGIPRMAAEALEAKRTLLKTTV